MTELGGQCDDRFEAVADLLRGSLEAGTDVGASVAVTLDGQSVVDLWGGHVDTARTRPWQADTIVNAWSTTKTMTSLAALVLADRGLLDVDAPVARYWPEFATNGKDGVLVRHLLAHTSGVAGWDQPVSTEDLYDLAASTARLAAQAPWWPPGSASGYHALNQGHLVGEVIRRIDGRTLGRFFAEEIARPLGADFHIGLDPSDDDRVSMVIPPDTPPVDVSVLPPDAPARLTLTGPRLDATAPADPRWRRAEIGAANGHGNARSVARIQSVVANGGEVDGVRLLAPATIDLIFREQANGEDLVLGMPIRFGIGYGLAEPAYRPEVPAGRICFWGGWGGSTIIVDCDRRMTVAYTMNRMLDSEADGRGEAITRAVYAALGVETH
ncbi:MAG: serine hydrolase domain-containing protein [Actinomycetota bacterium]